MNLGGRVLALSKWVHKYLGLFLAPFFLWMAVSGILLNHKDLLRSASLPMSFVGHEERYDNWSRGALRGAVFAPHDPQTGWFFGKEAVWATHDGGQTFERFDHGLPRAAALRDENSVVVAGGLLVLGGTGGLFATTSDDGHWTPLTLGEHLEDVVSVLALPERLVAVTKSGAYASPRSERVADLRFEPLPLPRDDPTPPKIDAVVFGFAVHSGEAWGWFGKLLMDLAGVLLILLSITGLLQWWFPWRYWCYKRYGGPRPKARPKVLSWSDRNHRKLGLVGSPLLLLTTLTGLLLTIPVVILLVGKSVEQRWAPGLRSDNPWHERIQGALYDETRGLVVISADGYWVAPVDFSAPFTRLPGGPDQNLMGTNVFAAEPDGDYLVGSFGGLFAWSPETARIRELGLGAQPAQRFGPVGGFMTSGWFRDPQGRDWAVDFRDGLTCLSEPSTDYRMPPEVVAQGRVPLWLFLHYLHNNRIWTMLPMPGRILFALFAALFAVGVVVSGVYDEVVDKQG